MTRSGRTLAELMADYVCGLSYADLPAEVVAKLKQVITHDIVVGLAGRDTEEAQRALDLLGTDLASPGRSTLIGHGRTAAPVDAAYVNTVMIRTLHQEDTIWPSGAHPGSMLIPAAFAVGEYHGNSGRELLAALAAGYEVVGKLANTQRRRTDGSHRHPSHTFGGFGVAVVAAKLMSLDATQTAAAIAYAANILAMIPDGFRNHQYGVVTRNGLTAAYLGQAGAPAARDALESRPGFFASVIGAAPDGLEEDLALLGVRWEVLTSVTKSYPCRAGNAIAVELLQRVLTDHQLDRLEVVRIRVRQPQAIGDDTVARSKGPWENSNRAVSSLPFALAAVLLDGHVTPERLHRHDDPAVFDLAQNVDFEFDDSFERLHRHVEVETRAGDRLSSEGDQRVLADPDPAAVLRLHHASEADLARGACIAETVARLDALDSLAEVAQAFG